MAPLRIALLQGPAGALPGRREGLAALEAAARTAAAGGARLLVASELFLSGYATDPAVHAEPADGPGARAVAAIAADHGLFLAYGYPERDGTEVYNAVRLITPYGHPLANYRKTHLFGDFERRSFTPGDTTVVQADVDGLRVGMLICYDVEFPELVRAHALAGTELLLVPTALMRPYEFVARTLVPARAYESQLYIAYANRVGAEGEHHFAGLSCLAAPDGTVRARAGDGGEDLLLAEVDPARIAGARRDNTYLADLRPELYA